MNRSSQKVLYPKGRSTGFYSGQPVSEPVDDYMTGVDIFWEILDILHPFLMEHSYNAARLDSVTFITEIATSMPWLEYVDETDKMDETVDEDDGDDTYIIDAADEMDIVDELDGTTVVDMGDSEAMDIVKMGEMDEVGEMEMVIDT